MTNILENELSKTTTSTIVFIDLVGAAPIKHLPESEFQWHSELVALTSQSILDNLLQTYLQFPLEYTHLSEFATKLIYYYTTRIFI
jgi:hypothetical protein